MPHGQRAVDKGSVLGFESLRQAVRQEVPSLSRDLLDRSFEGLLAYLQGPLECEPVIDPGEVSLPWAQRQGTQALGIGSRWPKVM